jgi:1,2-diacylglycerol 3-alpha-glucosyltransferase/glucuronosyltransferase
VQGPLDVIGDAPVGVLDEDLEKACKAALLVPRDDARAFAVQRSWRSCTEQFLSNLAIDHDT